MRLTLLHCDDDLAVIDKPAGLPTHAAQDDPAPTDAVRLLREQLGGDYLGVHQRLDRDTSGVLLFARRPEANAALAAAFEGRLAAKRYLAIVHGAPRAAEGRIDLALAPAAQSGQMRIAPPNDPRAQPAVTAYRTLAIAP
ncbi:MAG TPA: pseudouridine synthase, partial [Herpetosiphonaceae bacterium]